MASWQARLAVQIIKWRVKRKLLGVRDYRVARKILRPDPYTVPAGIRVSPANVGGVPGEWVEASEANPDAKPVLVYLHGGGYFACSAESHRPITVAFAREGFRVLAPDYRLAPENQFPAAVDDAVAAYRKVMGATNPKEAADGTIRKLFALSIGENSVHGSDSLENAKIEIAQFFTDSDIVG